MWSTSVSELDQLRNQLFDLVEGKVKVTRSRRRGRPIRVDGRQRQKTGSDDDRRPINKESRAKAARHHRVYVQGLDYQASPPP